MSDSLVWLFGCGLSIGCGLKWRVPLEWKDVDRERKIGLITDELRARMDSSEVDTTAIRSFLAFLANRTVSGWRHLFLTTNWDFLLQREVARSITDGRKPYWAVSSAVFHLNGTVEQSSDPTHRSPFLLEQDTYTTRHWTVEANVAYNKMIMERAFVVVGMSFECETDRFLLHALHKVENDLPVGESTWIIVNPNQTALDLSAERIKKALPGCRIHKTCQTFNSWLLSELPELISLGVFTSR
jgi:hypothetical protein